MKPFSYWQSAEQHVNSCHLEDCELCKDILRELDSTERRPLSLEDLEWLTKYNSVSQKERKEQ